MNLKVLLHVEYWFINLLNNLTSFSWLVRENIDILKLPFHVLGLYPRISKQIDSYRGLGRQYMNKKSLHVVGWLCRHVENLHLKS